MRLRRGRGHHGRHGRRGFLFHCLGIYAGIRSPVQKTGFPGSTLLPFVYGGVSSLKPNIRRKGTLIIKGLLGNLVLRSPFASCYTPRCLTETRAARSWLYIFMSRPKRLPGGPKSYSDLPGTPKVCSRAAFYGYLGHYFTYFWGVLGRTWASSHHKVSKEPAATTLKPCTLKPSMLNREAQVGGFRV